MSRVHVFADESGNFDFRRKPNVPRYFILTTVTVPDFTLGDELLALRRELAWEGVETTPDFHATEERQAVRDRVFEVLGRHDFRIDTTILEKPKTEPHLQADEARFYQTAWYLHFRYVAPAITHQDDQLLVIAASIGTRKKQESFHNAIRDVVRQLAPHTHYRTAFWHAATDPCLWAADYCCWAIQRKWEGGDDRSYVLIGDTIRSEFDAFGASSTVYY